MPSRPTAPACRWAAASTRRCSPSPATGRCRRRSMRSKPVDSRPTTSPWTCPAGRRELEARVSPSGPNEVTAIVRDFTEMRAVEAEVRRSRARIVEATDEERRRLERDLHDGAQQRLVSVSLALRRIRARLSARPGEDAEAVAASDEAAAELKLAIQELRELARGIHPAILTEAGLGRRDHCPRRAVRRARDGSLRPGSAAAAGGRGDRLLRRVRGARERRQARQRDERQHRRDRDADDPARRGRRRRCGRRRCRERDRHPRAAGSRRRDRRHAQDGEPGGPGHAGGRRDPASARSPSQGLPGSLVREVPRADRGTAPMPRPSPRTIVCSSIGRHPADEEGAPR